MILCQQVPDDFSEPTSPVEEQSPLFPCCSQADDVYVFARQIDILEPLSSHVSIHRDYIFKHTSI